MSTTIKLEKRAEQVLFGSEGVGGKRESQGQRENWP
jgi:hypothetical protein